MRTHMLCCVVLTLLSVSAHAHTRKPRLEGMPQVGVENTVPANSIYRDRRYYYTAPHQGPQPLTCSGEGDTMFIDYYEPTVLWDRCEPADPEEAARADRIAGQE